MSIYLHKLNLHWRLSKAPVFKPLIGLDVICNASFRRAFFRKLKLNFICINMPLPTYFLIGFASAKVAFYVCTNV